MFFPASTLPANRVRLAQEESNRGVAFAQVRQNAEAIECFRRAIAIDPSLAAAHTNLGALLADRSDMGQARESLEAAVGLQPDSPQAHLNLANVLAAVGDLDAAVDHCRRSLAIRPGSAEALTALGNALKDQGLLNGAIDAYSRAAEFRPDLPAPASNRLYALHFDPDQTPATLLAAHRDWAQRFAAPLRSVWREHSNDPNAGRRLKIGYVSADFREHPVGRFILPLLQHHDREQYEVICYANLRAADSMTDRIRQHADVWQDIALLSDEEACEMIHSDRIDILVDLTMHMRSNRLLVFARKPAPVQVTYLAYCSTTGLDAIDDRLTDSFLDPIDDETSNDDCYVERSVRLAKSYWCYQPDASAPELNALPASTCGKITFACLNNFCKVTTPTLETWRKLLEALPDSRLILHTSQGSHCDRVRTMLGVDPSRVSFTPRLPMRQYFEQYHQIDIALDPFPYTGGTTTCDALWMGVPVVSLAGGTAVSRSGLSILSNIGRAEWVARSAEEYLQIAIELARNLDCLSSIRRTLRDGMRRSPLMDAPRFARDVEGAYRFMWREWCVGCLDKA
jgi:protein O-GlcNAc transferase